MFFVKRQNQSLRLKRFCYSVKKFGNFALLKLFIATRGFVLLNFVLDVELLVLLVFRACEMIGVPSLMSSATPSCAFGLSS